MIIKIESSPVAMKRYRVHLDNGKKYDFGYRGARTYIDDRTLLERANYRKRHLANKIENRLIKNLVPSPSLFSYYLLWGESKDLHKNIEFLNARFREKDLG